MLKRSLITSVILAASLNAGMFGDLAGAAMGTIGGGDASSTVSGNDVQAVLTNFQQAEMGLNNSVDMINKALGDKKQLAEWEEKEKSINAMPASSEKDAATKKLNEDQMSYATKISESKDVQDKAKKLSSEQKKKVGISIGNLLLVALKDAEALTRAKGLVGSISSNPAVAMKFATDLPKLKDVVTTVPSQLSSLATLTSGYVGMAKSAGISVTQPKSADEPLKEVEI